MSASHFRIAIRMQVEYGSGRLDLFLVFTFEAITTLHGIQKTTSITI